MPAFRKEEIKDLSVAPDPALDADDYGVAGLNPLRLRRRLINFLIIACLLAACGAVYLHNLGSSYITLWDEAIQVNVVQNLAEHCCLPYLHRSSAVASLGGAPALNGATTQGFLLRHIRPGTDYRNWANDTVWLHKPLLAFYVAAVTYKLGGGTLWGLRLSGAIFALLNVAVVYQIGRKFLSSTTGLCAAAIFGLNPYTNELVHGQAFVGFPDLALSCSVTAAMYFVLHWTQYKTLSSLRWLGVAVALGYMCKGGLALGPFAVLVVITVLAGAYRDFLPILQSLAIFAALVASEELYWRIHYRELLRFESHEQLRHLFQSVEGWGAPWNAYLTGYLPAILTLPLVPIAYFSVLWAVSRFKPFGAEFVLGIWALIYVSTLSLSVSKVENHIFSILPAFALLIPRVFENFFRNRHFDLVLAFCGAALGIVFLTRAWWDFRHPGIFGLLAVAAIIPSGVLRWLPQWQSKRADLAISVLAWTAVLLLFLNITESLRNNSTQPGDSTAQALLRKSGIAVRSVVDQDGLILAHTPSIDLPYLYLMYWSGVDVLDPCNEPDPSSAISILRNENGLYLITKQPLRANTLAKTR